MLTQHYSSIFNIIQARTGLIIKEARAAETVEMLDTLAHSHGLDGTSELRGPLAEESTTSALWQSIIQYLTIGETYFWRNQAHFEALAKEVLPALISQRRRQGHKFLRLWSAGCASGEEPYSLAMLLHDLLPDLPEWNITLLGTDLNMASLERARRGIYRPSSFRRETPGDVRDRWFRPVADGYELIPAIRRMVIFHPFNLIEDPYPSFQNGTMNMDIIMCRNVTIYFERPAVIEVARRFYKSLNSGGWLIVGHSEPLASNYEDFAALNIGQAVVYHKAEPPQVPVTAQLTAPPVAPPPSKWTAPPAPPTTSSRRQRSKPVPLPQTNNLPPIMSPIVPNAADNWLKQAQTAADREEWATALECLGHAEQHDQLRPEIHYLRGLVLFYQDDLDTALQALRQSVYCEPQFVLAHYTLGEVYERMREYGMAERHWQRGIMLLTTLRPDALVSFSTDLTVEMLRGLLRHRLNTLPRRR